MKYMPLETPASPAVHFVSFIFSEDKPGLTERPAENIHECFAYL